MVVVNFRLKKKNILIALAVIVGLTAILLIAFSGGDKKKSDSKKKSEISESELCGETENDRIDFLEKMGYKTTGESTEQRDVVVPYEFNDVYLNYNAIQKNQGFDLSNYCGCRATQYCYEITNYDGYDKTVYAHILVFEGKIIGGDIAAAELNGFMHGFKK